jgi:Mor family transcriptional regulator
VPHRISSGGAFLCLARFNINMDILSEGMGDSPNWMEIHGTSQDHKNNRSEIVLKLGEGTKAKTYWFPATPRVVRKFRSLVQESRSKGLKYLQGYIRRYREYSGWTKLYAENNRIKDGHKSLTVTLLSMFSEGQDVQEISNKLNLSLSLVERVVSTFTAETDV